MPSGYDNTKDLDALFEGSETDTKEEQKIRAEKIFKALAVNVDEFSSLNEQLQHGPLAKNQFTMDFEYIAECLCDPGLAPQVKFSVKNHECTVQVASKIFNLSAILKNMDARHVYMSENAKENYVKNQKHYQLPDSAKDEKYNDMHEAEKIAIHVYTGDHYVPMNNLLRGKNLDKIDIKTYLLHSAMCLSGLNKIPDIHIKQAYRGERGEARKVEKNEAVDKKEIVIERGFVSTAVDRFRWNKKKIDQKIIFHDILGKDISGLSKYPNEREFLMPPTQMRYEAKREENGVTYYSARAVMTLTGLNKEQQTLGVQLNHTLLDEVIIKIEAAYNNEPVNLKPHFWRKFQIRNLVNTAISLSSDKKMPAHLKCDKMLKELKSVEKCIKRENKLRGFFGIQTHSSRLEKVIGEIEDEYKLIKNSKPKI